MADADARQDEVDGSLLRWSLCHFLLVGGKKPSFSVQNFIDLVQEVSLHVAPVYRRIRCLRLWHTMSSSRHHSMGKGLNNACMQTQ